MFDLRTSRFIDLTRTLHSDMVGVEFESARTVEKDGWNAQYLRLYSHIGTHMDAPFHFGISNETIDDFTPEQLMGKAWLVRIEAAKAQQLLLPSDMQAIEEKIQAGDNLLIRTDWSKVEDYATFRDKLPRISPELAHWCVEKGVNMLGVEPPSVADVNNLEEVTEVHRILLEGGVIIVEGLVNLDQIQSDTVWFIALPLKIADGDGAPIRAIAVEEVHSP